MGELIRPISGDLFELKSYRGPKVCLANVQSTCSRDSVSRSIYNDQRTPNLTRHGVAATGRLGAFGKNS